MMMDRRVFLRSGAAWLAGPGVLAAAGRKGFRSAAAFGRGRVRPNILVILVDQWRFPRWYAPSSGAGGLPPNVAALRRGGVLFGSHYTAANDCSPARSTLLTGLYALQTGCLITGQSTLSPGFQTWGTMLRQHGYRTFWYGKWHLTRDDDRWTEATGARALESYGFSGGTFPSPDGSPGQGTMADPLLVKQFARWYASEGADAPWCTTVSLVNPHDIAWWYDLTNRVSGEKSAPSMV